MIAGASVSVSDIMIALVRHRAFTRGDLRGHRADFSFRDISRISLNNECMSGVSFKGSNLSNSSIRSCELTGADFFGADLEGTDLSGSNLTGADFRGANLNRAILSNTNLRNADFRASTPQNGTGGRNARLNEAKIDHAILCQANLSGCDMSGADLSEADLTGADLSQTVLLGADLSGASLSNSRLSNTILELSRLTGLQISQLGTTDGIIIPTFNAISSDELQRLISAHEQWFATSGAEGSRLDLSGINLDNVRFNIKNLAGCRLRKCSIQGSNIEFINLDMSDLSYSSFIGSSFEGASMRGVNLRGSDLSRAVLKDVRLEQMPLDAGRFWSANLAQAMLKGANLTGASFTNAIMHGADIRGALTSNATFIGVDLNFVKIDDGVNLNNEKDNRVYVRYSEPRLFVKIDLGVFSSINWSIGGVIMSFASSERLKVGDEITASIVAKELPTPLKTQFIVIRDEPERERVYLKFKKLTPEVKDYFESLAEINRRMQKIKTN